MSTAHPLRDIERIDGPPGPYLEAIGTIFATFGAPTQDSGNVSYGVQVGASASSSKPPTPRPRYSATTPPAWRSCTMRLDSGAVAIIQPCQLSIASSKPRTAQHSCTTGLTASAYMADATTRNRRISDFAACPPTPFSPCSTRSTICTSNSSSAGGLPWISTMAV